MPTKQILGCHSCILFFIIVLIAQNKKITQELKLTGFYTQIDSMKNRDKSAKRGVTKNCRPTSPTLHKKLPLSHTPKIPNGVESLKVQPWNFRVNILCGQGNLHTSQSK